MRNAPAIGFECRVSWVLVAATVAVGVLAVVAVWISGLPPWAKSLGMVLAAASTAHAVAVMLRPRIKSLILGGDGGVEIRLRDTALEDGAAVQGAVQAARVMGPLIVLTLRWPPRERATLWLLPDNLDADTRRRLRMRLGAEAGHVLSGNPDSR